jgi:hypothetical protein
MSLGTELTARERAVLAELADVLIPSGGEMPSASEAGVAGDWLDAVLSARPDLVDPLKAILASAGDVPAAEAVERLREGGGFGILAEIVPNAYYMNPAIRDRIGYPLQQAVPIDANADDDPEAQKLIASVRARGTIYRPTP